MLLLQVVGVDRAAAAARHLPRFLRLEGSGVHKAAARFAQVRPVPGRLQGIRNGKFVQLEVHNHTRMAPRLRCRHTTRTHGSSTCTHASARTHTHPRTHGTGCSSVLFLASCSFIVIYYIVYYLFIILYYFWQLVPRVLFYCYLLYCLFFVHHFHIIFGSWFRFIVIYFIVYYFFIIFILFLAAGSAHTLRTPSRTHWARRRSWARLCSTSSSQMPQRHKACSLSQTQSTRSCTDVDPFLGRCGPSPEPMWTES